MNSILTVTLNPAIDITTATSHVAPGRKLRCGKPIVEPGGGGVNVSRMVGILGGRSTALVAIGGAVGEWLRQIMLAQSLHCVFVEASGDTRMNVVVHEQENSDQYRFVLPGPVQDAGFEARVVKQLETTLGAGSYEIVVGSGSLPPGVADDFYAVLAEVAVRNGARFILDASGPALLAGLGPHVEVVKPNDIEARDLAESLGLAPDDFVALGQYLVAQRKTRAAVLTMGEEGALLITDGVVRHIKPPRVSVVSKVGAGDSFVGTMAHGLATGMPIEQAFALGVSAAAAAVMTPSTELARREDVERIHAEIMAAQQDADVAMRSVP